MDVNEGLNVLVLQKKTNLRLYSAHIQAKCCLIPISHMNQITQVLFNVLQVLRPVATCVKGHRHLLFDTLSRMFNQKQCAALIQQLLSIGHVSIRACDNGT